MTPSHPIRGLSCLGLLLILGLSPAWLRAGPWTGELLPLPEALPVPSDEHDLRQVGALYLPDDGVPEPFRAGERSGWKLRLGDGMMNTPAVHDGMVFVGGGLSSKNFYALDAVTGKEVWSYEGSDNGPSSPVVEDGVVVYGTESCTLYAHEARSGQLLWSRWIGQVLISKPAIHEQRLFQAFPGPDGAYHLAAYQLRTGARLWDQQVSGEVLSAPVVHDGLLMATLAGGEVAALDPVTGEFRWRVDAGATTAPVPGASGLLIAQRSRWGRDEQGLPSVQPGEGFNRLDPRSGSLLGPSSLAVAPARYLAGSTGAAPQPEGDWAAFLAARREAAERMAGKLFPLLEVNFPPDSEAPGLIGQVGEVLWAPPSTDEVEAARRALQARAVARELESLARRHPELDTSVSVPLREAAVELERLAQQAVGAARRARRDGGVEGSREALGQLQPLADQWVTIGDGTPLQESLRLSAAHVGSDSAVSVWSYEGSRPREVNGRLVAARDGLLAAVDPWTGDEIWRRDLLTEATPGRTPGSFPFLGSSSSRRLTNPVPVGGKLYLGTASGKLLCLSAGDGATLWEAKVGGIFQSELVVADGALFGTTQEGDLVRLETGDPGADGWSQWGGGPGHAGLSR